MSRFENVQTSTSRGACSCLLLPSAVAPRRRVNALKQNAVSHNSIVILQFKAMSSWSDDDDGVTPISNAPLEFPDHLNGRTVLLSLVPDGMLQSATRPSSFARQLCARSRSSNARIVFLCNTVGSKRCRPSAALSWNVLHVGECASCFPAWRSRAVD